MKTLVNKRNPQIRITAPEIVLSANKEQYWIAGIPQTARTYLAKEWTLVEEESKHTEVWVEGRTIFEQDAKKPEMDLEKEMDKYYGMYRDKTGKTYDVEDDEPCFDWKEDELSENKMRMARHFYELGLKAKR